MTDQKKKKKRKGKPMSRALKAFLKKHGRFPRKGELRRSTRARGGKRSSHKKSKKKGGGRSHRSNKPRRRSRATISFG